MAPNAAKTIFCFVFFVENFVLLIKTHLETIIPALLVGQRTCEQYCCAVLAGFSLVNNGVNSAVRPTDRPAWPASFDPFQCDRPASNSSSKANRPPPATVGVPCRPGRSVSPLD